MLLITDLLKRKDLVKQAPPFITFPVAFVIKFVFRAPVTQHGVQPVICLCASPCACASLHKFAPCVILRLLQSQLQCVHSLLRISPTLIRDLCHVLIGLIGDALFID